MENTLRALPSTTEMEQLDSESTEIGITPRIIVDAPPNGEPDLEPVREEITPFNDAASSITPLSIVDDEPDDTIKDTPLSNKRVAGIAGLFFLFAVAFAVSSALVQSNEARLARTYSDLFDPGCIDKLGDAGPSDVARAFDLDLTFGNFTFTNAKIIDVAWDTAIGQGGRLLHGWILYRCVMRRLLLYAMEHYYVTSKYYLTISWSRASLELLWINLQGSLRHGRIRYIGLLGFTHLCPRVYPSFFSPVEHRYGLS